MTTYSSILYLSRFAYMPFYTLGRLTDSLNAPGSLNLATLECSWVKNPNHPGGILGVSCIPDGEYDILPYNSPSKPHTFQLVNVSLGVYAKRPADQPWGRDRILIHVANYVTELEGCIAVGEAHNVATIKDSTKALNKLRDWFAIHGLSRDTPAKLIIRPVEGTSETWRML